MMYIFIIYLLLFLSLGRVPDELIMNLFKLISQEKKLQ
jgi:hypothetical protein